MEFGKEYAEFSKTKQGLDFTCKGDWQKQYVEFVSRVFPDIKKPGVKAMDFGCALGATTSAFNDAGIDMVGLDCSPWYVENTPFENMKGKLYSYTNKMPFATKSFDFIHSQQTIEHIPEDVLPSVFKELFRISKRGCILYLATLGHSDEPLEERDDPTHITCYGAGFWLPLFEKAGFKDVTSEFMPSFYEEKFYQEYKWTQYIIQRP